MPILGISHALILLFRSYWPLLLSSLLYGYVLGVVAAQTPAIMFEIAGQGRYADGMAFVNIFYGLGNFCGGTLGGNFFQDVGLFSRDRNHPVPIRFSKEKKNRNPCEWPRNLSGKVFSLSRKVDILSQTASLANDFNMKKQIEWRQVKSLT